MCKVFALPCRNSNHDRLEIQRLRCEIVFKPRKLSRTKPSKISRKLLPLKSWPSRSCCGMIWPSLGRVIAYTNCLIAIAEAAGKQWPRPPLQLAQARSWTNQPLSHSTKLNGSHHLQIPKPTLCPYRVLILPCARDASVLRRLQAYEALRIVGELTIALFYASHRISVNSWNRGDKDQRYHDGYL